MTETLLAKPKRGETPSKDILVELYQDNTLREISELFGVTRARVSRWFDTLGIEKQPRGGGNNRKVIDDVTPEMLHELINVQRLTYKNAAEKLGCSFGNLRRLLCKYEVQKDYGEKTEFEKYYREVRTLTEKTYKENFETLNPNKYERTLAGVEGGYQLDHIKPITECFREKVPAEVCASVNNLQLITWEENLKRRKF